MAKAPHEVIQKFRYTEDGRVSKPSSRKVQVGKAKHYMQAQRRSVQGRSHLADLAPSIHEHLTVVFIGFNPGVQSSITQHHYAHPTNLFWRLFNESGICEAVLKYREKGRGTGEGDLKYSGSKYCVDSKDKLQNCGESECGESECGESECGEPECGESECGESECGESKCGESECGESECGESEYYGESECNCGDSTNKLHNSGDSQCCNSEDSKDKFQNSSDSQCCNSEDSKKKCRNSQDSQYNFGNFQDSQDNFRNYQDSKEKYRNIQNSFDNIQNLENSKKYRNIQNSFDNIQNLENSKKYRNIQNSTEKYRNIQNSKENSQNLIVPLHNPPIVDPIEDFSLVSFLRVLFDTNGKCRAQPKHDYQLSHIGIGFTDLVLRCTKQAQELSMQEKVENVPRLFSEFSLSQAPYLVFIGKGIWEAICRYLGDKVAEFSWGLQTGPTVEKVQVHCSYRPKVYVFPSTSGLVASMKYRDKLMLWEGLAGDVSRE